jgi:sterol 3beta-glucosyltransferase
MLILTLGTRGDVQPFLALGAGLRARGHEVRLATGRGFAGPAARHGLEYAPLEADFAALVRTPETQAALRSPRAALRAWRELGPMIRQVLDGTWVAAEGAEAVVYHPKALAGIHIAERLRIPAFAAAVQPILTPTRAFPSPLLPVADLTPAGNRLSHAAVLRLLALPYRRLVDEWRAEALGLPPRLPCAGELTLLARPVPRLYGFSPSVVPAPPDWGPESRVTGYWFPDPDPDAGWEPPGALARFLAAGEPPVYVGFGSMAGPDAPRLTAVVAEALARAGQRGVLATGWGGLSAGNSPDRDHVFVLREAPHSWLFPRVAAVVHHGGAGTTHEGLRWGRPTLACPVFGDQPFWGRRVAALGAGPRSIPQRSITTEALADAIRGLVTDPRMRERARTLGESIRSERGVTVAVDAIGQELQKAVSPEAG